MRVHATKPLFPWDELEVSPTLAVIKETLETIPDVPLLDALRERRHNGCDTDPVSVSGQSPTDDSLPTHTPLSRNPCKRRRESTKICAACQEI